MNLKPFKNLNLVPVPPMFSSVSALMVLTLNILLNSVVVGALLYIFGEKLEKRGYEFISMIMIGTLVAQYLDFMGYVGVILVFVLYAFLSRSVMRCEPVKAIGIGFVMALLTLASMHPAIGAPIYEVTEALARGMTGMVAW